MNIEEIAMNRGELTENQIRQQIKPLEELLAKGEGTVRDADRLDDLRRQLRTIENAKYGRRYWYV